MTADSPALNGDPQDRAAFPDEELISGFFTYRISILAKKLDRRAARIVERDFGLKLNEWWVLGNIPPDDTVAVRDLVQRIHIDKSQISRALARLLSLGLVIKKDDPADGRSPRFSLTEQGAVVRADILAARVTENAELAALLDAAEHAAMDAALERLDQYVTGLDAADAF